MDSDEDDGSRLPAPKTKTAFLPWIEKYRPKKIDDVAHQTEVVRALKACVASNNLPHLLFYGPPGTGKTSAALAAARELFGGDRLVGRVLELNASDDRGIGAIRTKVKAFAAASAASAGPTFKLIILDEADAMTSDAQNALRRLMETHARVTRFCLICNYVSRIIEPLASRCAKFRFQSLPVEAMSDRLRSIAETENVVLDPEALRALVECSGGDMRRALLSMQSAARLGGGRVTASAVRDAAGSIPADRMATLLAAWRSGSVERAHAATRALLREGHSAAAALNQAHDAILADENLNDLQRARALSVLAEADHALVDGSDEMLQLLHVSAAVVRTIAGLPL